MSQTKAQLISDLVQALAFTGTSSAPDNGVYLSAANTLAFNTNSAASPRLTIDSSGRLLVGATSSSGDESLLQIASAGGTCIEVFRASNNDGPPFVTFNKSRGTNGSPNVVNLDDRTGGIVFNGYSATATAYLDCARIEAYVDGEPDSSGDTSDMPGRIEFSTTLDGASSPTTRMTIKNDGKVGVGTTAPSSIFQIESTNPILTFERNNNATNPAGAINFATNDNTVKWQIGTNQSIGVGFEINQGDATNNLLYIDTSGNFGLGPDGKDALEARTSQGYRSLRLQNANITAGTSQYAYYGVNYYQDTSGVLRYIDNGYSGRMELWGDFISFNLSTGNADDAVTGSELGRFDSSGRFLIGTPSPYSDSSELFEVHKANGPNNGWVSTPNLANDDSVSWRALGGVSGVTLRQSGIGVYKHSGIATPCGFLYMQAQNADTLYYWTDNSSNFRISTLASNIGTTSGTVVGTQTSDERIKNIIGPVEYGLETVKQINPVRYSLKADPETEKLGFIAQQVAPLVPQAIYDTNETIEGEPEGAPTKLGMEYVSLIPVLVNAIKELSAEVDALKAQLQIQ